MRPPVYLAILLLLLPVQAGLLAPLDRLGIRPDLGLAIVYTIGLLTGPGEAALAGVAFGLLQDVGTASLLGFSGLTRGLVGITAGVLGQRVLDVRSSSNSLFLFAFSIAESLLAALFLEAAWGDVPLGSLLVRQMLPRAFFTALAGYVILRLATRRNVPGLIMRHELQKER